MRDARPPLAVHGARGGALACAAAPWPARLGASPCPPGPLRAAFRRVPSHTVYRVCMYIFSQHQTRDTQLAVLPKMYTRPWYVHSAGYLHLARGSGTRAVTTAPSRPSHWRGSVHVAELWTEGQVEGVHVVTAVGFQQASHTKKQQQSCLEGQGRPHHAPHPAAAIPVPSTPTHVIGAATSLTNLVVFGPHPPPEIQKIKIIRKLARKISESQHYVRAGE